MSKLDKNFDLQELLESLQDLDPQNMGGWPTPVKIGTAVLAFVLVAFLGYFLEISPKYDTLDQQARREADLMTQYESKAFKRSEEHTSELQSRENLVCRLLLEKKKKKTQQTRREDGRV